MTDTRRREHTRARIVAAAEEVFAARGVRRVTVDDLVAAAGFTRGAFYSNFESIEQVFYALFTRLSEEMLATVRSTVEDVPDEEFGIGVVMRRLHPVAQRWYPVQAELTLMALRSEEAREVFREHRARFQDEMHQLLEQLIDRLGRRPEVPIEVLAEVAFALYLHALMQEVAGIAGFSVDELTDTVLPRVLLGLSSEK